MTKSKEKAAACMPTTNALAGTFMALFGLLGIFASFMLVESEFKMLRDPLGSLGCDINPLVACSTSLNSSYSSLFGISNSIFGLVVFSVFTTIGVLLAAGTALPRWVWWGAALGGALGVGYVIYFASVSVFHFQTLCPYCMLAWVAFLGIAAIIWTQSLAIGVFGEGASATGQSLARLWWLILIGALLLIFLFVLIGLHDKVAQIL